MLSTRLTAALASSALLAASGGATAGHTIVKRSDMPRRAAVLSDAYTGSRLEIEEKDLSFDQLKLGDKVAINGEDYDLVASRKIAHQGPAFVIGVLEAVEKGDDSRLVLHDALHDQDRKVDLGTKNLSTLRPGDPVSVEGERHMVSAVVQDTGGDTILTVPHGDYLSGWSFASAEVLKFKAPEDHVVSDQAVS